MIHPDFHTLLLIAILVVAICILRILIMLQTALSTLATNQAAEAKITATTGDTVARVEKLIADGTDQVTLDAVNAAAKASASNTLNVGALNDRLTVIAPIPPITANQSAQTQGNPGTP